MERLKNKVRKNGFTINETARKIGMDPATFYRKMPGGGERFKVGEVQRMYREGILTRNEVIEIFLPE